MKKYNIKPYRRRKKPRKKGDENKAKTKYSNLIKQLCPKLILRHYLFIYIQIKVVNTTHSSTQI